MVDESFLLNYITLKTLDDDIEEKQDTNKEIQDMIVDQMIDKMLELNENLSEEQLQKLIANKYEIVKYKKIAVIKEVQKIFKEHIRQYMNKIGSVEEC